jgi:cobalt-zinc-cadmium efflux system membrane fusion protein
MNLLRALCCVAMLIVTACSGRVPEPEPRVDAAATAAMPTDIAPNRRWLAIRDADTVRTFEATGRLLAPPDSRSEVTLPLAASIVALRVSPGESVKAGQVLAELAIVEAARAQGQLDGARLRVEAHAARLAQLEQLRGEGLARGADIAEARARLSEDRASAHEAEVLLDALASSHVQLRGRHYVLLAPIAGVVIAVDAPIGSTRGPGDGPACVISSGAVTRVEARFGFTFPAGASFELWAQGKRMGGLALVTQAPEVSPSDATRAAWFDLTEPTTLPQGSIVRVRMRMPRGTWVVPQSALSGGDAPNVLTARGVRVPLDVLAMFGGVALARGELQPNDLVAEEDAAP